MPLLEGTQQQYYENSQSFTATAGQTDFTLTFSPLPTLEAEFDVFVNSNQINSNTYSYNNSTGVLTLPAQTVGNIVLVQQVAQNESLGNYQFIDLGDIINNFIISYVGENKLIPKVRRADIAFHAQRAIQELSYDTFRSIKSQEIELSPSLSMAMPHDYVNYVKLTWKDDKGVEHVIYPTGKTSNPRAMLQDDNYDFIYNENGEIMEAADSNTWNSFRTTDTDQTEDLSDSIYDRLTNSGRRYGLNPESSQANGLFFIDQSRGKIYFSSDLVNKCIILKYISDSLGTEQEIVVHKFAEEAMYKWIAHAILSTRINIPEYLVQRFKRERFAAIRTAKLRMSNIKIEELTQIMRGKSKQIKH